MEWNAFGMSARAETNVVGFLRRSAERVPDRPALIFAGSGGEGGDAARLTFAELWRRADRLSAGLAAAGLAAGDRAIVMIPMSLDLYAVLLGLLKLGAVAVFVDPWIGRRQIGAFAAFAEPRAYIGIGKSHLLRLLDSRLRRLPIAITTGRRLWRWPAPVALGELEWRDGDGRVHEVAGDDPALITFTSGSSGEPKGANRTHGFLAAQHEALRHEFPYEDDDVDMPMFPVFALNNLALGIPSVVPQMDFRRVEAVDPAVIVRQMQRHRVTTCTASPPFFDRLAGQIEANPSTRPRLRRALTGGAPVSDAQLRAWRRALPETEILVVYGSTEAEPVAHIAAEERLAATSQARPHAPGYCVGRPTPRIRTRVIRIERGALPDDGRGGASLDVEPGAIGELLVSGDHVCRDYFRNPAARAANKLVDAAGAVWHRMGDTGYFDGEGRFWLVGRVHSTIMRAGRAVHPLLLEQAAGADDPRIRRAAAVGVRDAGLGERVVVVLETAAGAAVRDEAEMRIRDAGLTVDEIVVSDEELPVDPRHNSKIDYPRLRMRLEARA